MHPYTVQDLGVLPGGDYTYPRAINNKGEVVGFGNGATYELAFLWTGAAGIKALPLIPGADLSTAYDINDHSEIVGSCALHTAGSAPAWYSSFATHWKSGIVKNINPLTQSVARAINNNGDIAGEIYDAGSTACTWIGGATKFLAHDIYHGAPTRNSGVAAILTNGEVYGNCLQSTGMLYPYQTATKWDIAGNVYDLDFPDNLDKIGSRGRDSIVRAANDTGTAVGSTFYFPGEQPFFWNAAGKGLLGMLPGSLEGDAYGINTIGQVVGWLDNGSGHRAMLWSGPVITDLNDLIDPLSGWVLTEANCLNNAGQIAGIGMLNGIQRAFLIQPAFRIINIPYLYWHIIFGIINDGPGIILGPHGPEPGPDPNPIKSLLHLLPEFLRPDLENMLVSQRDQKNRGLKNK